MPSISSVTSFSRSEHPALFQMTSLSESSSTRPTTRRKVALQVGSALSITSGRLGNGAWSTTFKSAVATTKTLVSYLWHPTRSYQHPAEFIDAVEKSRSPRQVLFEAFAAQSMDVLASCVPTATNRPPPVVMLTGGLNTLPRMTSVLVHNHAHLLGVARLAVTCPRLPAELSTALATGDTELFMTEPPQPTELGVAPPSYLSARGAERLLYYVLKLLWMLIPGRVPRIVGASASVNWYNVMLRRIAFGQEIDWTLGTIGSTIRCYLAPTPYLPKEGDAAWRWWAGMTVLGIAMGVGLGRVI